MGNQDGLPERVRMTQRIAPLFALLILAALASGLLWRSNATSRDSSAGTSFANAPSGGRNVPPNAELHRRIPRVAEAAEPFPQHLGDSVFDSPPNAPLQGTSPGRIPGASSAGGANSKRLRAMIRTELPQAGEAEIDTWEGILKGMSIHRARDLLQLRKQVPLDSDGGAETPSRPPGRLVPQPLEAPSTLLPPVDSRPLRPIPTPDAAPALQQARDVILHNIANANTPAFKRSRVVFGEQARKRVSDGDDANADHTTTSGGGVEIAAIRRDWSPGGFVKTGRPLDLAVDGDGFLELQAGDRVVYTRGGSFERGASGRVVLRSNGEKFTLSQAVSADDANPFDALPVVRFGNPDGLESLGRGLFAETDASGPAELAKRSGTVKPGFLETSNVDLERELEDLKRLVRLAETLRAAERMWSEAGSPAEELKPLEPPSPIKPTVASKPKRQLKLQLQFRRGRLLPRIDLR